MDVVLLRIAFFSLLVLFFVEAVHSKECVVLLHGLLRFADSMNKMEGLLHGSLARGSKKMRVYHRNKYHNMKKIKLKSIGPELADIIVDIHFDSVHKGNASHYYDKEILNAWSPPISEERINGFKNKMSETQPITILACYDGIPVGFGIFDLKQQRIGAIYVKAAYTNYHIGISLLNELEKIAIQNGCEKLHLDSSLNAKTFYEKHGFVSISEGFFVLPYGKRMNSISMSKMLTKG